MTIGEGKSVAGDFRNASEGQFGSSSMLSRVSSRFSVASTTTFLSPEGGYGGQLNHLTQLINKYTALYHATIVSTEGYTQPIRLGVPHRFLLLELARPGKKTIWLRLDRRRSTSIGTFGFVRSGGSTQANDTVSIYVSQTKSKLVKANDTDSIIFVKRGSAHGRGSMRKPTNVLFASHSFSSQSTPRRHNRKARYL